MLPPSVVALPLRVGSDGRLAHGEPVEQLVRLLRVMAATRPQAWPHAPWFGLAEVFAEANAELEDQQGIADAINLALAALGVGWARVAYVHSVPAGYGERTFRAALEVAGERSVRHADLSV